MPAAYHAFEVRDTHFLLDIERSFLYSVSAEAYQEISGDQNRSVPFHKRLGAKLEWRALRRRLRPLSEAERQAEMERLARMRTDLAGLWLGVSHVCNLGCDYCFANEPAYLGRNKLMSVDTALRGVDYLIEHSGDTARLDITFFGGEPLLNLPVIDAVVDYCRRQEKAAGKEFTYAMTTNGTLLTREVFDKLVDYGIYPMISMDGTREIHDTFRRTKSGQPTWDRIVGNLQEIPEFGRYLPVRATVVDADIDLVACLKSLQEVGFENIIISGVCPNSGLDSNQGRFEIDIWKKRLMELVDHTLKTAHDVDEIPEHFLREAALGLKERARHYFCCGTGRFYYYLDPDRDLYPCFRLMTPDGGHRIGSLDTDLNEEKTRDLLQTNVLATSCYECWARYLCGGPCFGDSFMSSGDLSSPHPAECARRRFVIKCGAYLLARFQNS